MNRPSLSSIAWGKSAAGLTAPLLLLLVLLLAPPPGLLNAAEAPDSDAPQAAALGSAVGRLLPPDADEACAWILEYHWDGSAENAIAWQGNGCQSPDYGAFADCWTGYGQPLGLQLCLTRNASCPPGRSLDAYVWADDAGIPGQVVAMTPGFYPDDIAIWPEISVHDVCIECGTVFNLDEPFLCGYCGAIKAIMK